MNVGAALSADPQTLGLPSRPIHSCIISRKMTAPRRAWIGMLAGEWRFRSAACGPDTQYDYKFVCLSHNTLRGAAGGAVLIAELLCAEGYMG